MFYSLMLDCRVPKVGVTPSGQPDLGEVGCPSISTKRGVADEGISNRGVDKNNA